VANRWRIYCEKQPLRFLDRELFPHLVQSIRCLSLELGAQPGTPCAEGLLKNAPGGSGLVNGVPDNFPSVLLRS
jgi:hypothetical protein